VLKLEVPGIEEKDLDVRVEDHTPDREGRAQFEKREGREFPSHRARYGSFYRAFTLPRRCLQERAASYNAGVLKLELKKKPEASPSR